MPAKPTTFDGVLAGFSPSHRAALEKLRKAIRAAAPNVEEGVSYGLAAFRLDGKPLVGLGAAANHCAFYLMSGSMVDAFRADLAGYDTSKGTIRFPANKPLPAALVKKLVKARIAENAVLLEKAKKPAKAKTDDPAVAQFLKDLDHPLRKEIEAVRRIIRGVSPAIQEGIKWNSPSFRTTEWFATLNLRQDRVWLILHLGAKVKAGPKPAIPDPSGLLEWLGKDRAVVKFADGKDVKAKKPALAKLVREWIKVV